MNKIKLLNAVVSILQNMAAIDNKIDSGEIYTIFEFAYAEFQDDFQDKLLLRSMIQTAFVDPIPLKEAVSLLKNNFSGFRVLQTAAETAVIDDDFDFFEALFSVTLLDELFDVEGSQNEKLQSMIDGIRKRIDTANSAAAGRPWAEEVLTQLVAIEKDAPQEGE